MSTDPQALAVAYAAAPEGSEERKRHFEAFANHWRGPDGSIRVGEMDAWLKARAPRAQPVQQAPAPTTPQAAGRVSDEQFEKVGPAERLNHVRQFDQSKMPAWRDPRVA